MTAAWDEKKLWWCGGGGVVFLWWCGGVFVVVFLRFCGCVCVFFAVVFCVLCFCVFVVVFLWLCFCVGGVVFLRGACLKAMWSNAFFVVCGIVGRTGNRFSGQMFIFRIPSFMGNQVLVQYTKVTKRLILACYESFRFAIQVLSWAKTAGMKSGSPGWNHPARLK